MLANLGSVEQLSAGECASARAATAVGTIMVWFLPYLFSTLVLYQIKKYIALCYCCTYYNLGDSFSKVCNRH